MPRVRRGESLHSGPSSPVRDDSSQADGVVQTPGVGGGPSGMFQQIADLLSANNERQRRPRGRPRRQPPPDEAEESLVPASEESGEAALVRTIQEARQQERTFFVQRMEHVREDTQEDDDDELRARERAAMRTTRRNGRFTKVGCFMCHYGNYDFDSTADKGNQPFVRLRNMLRSRYPYSDAMTLYTDCAEIYHVELREPSRQDDGSYLLPEMLPTDFMEHHLEHNLNPHVMLGEDLRFIRDMLRVLRANLSNASGNMGLKIIDMIIKVMKHKSTILGMGGRPLTFEGRNGNDPMGIDPSQMGDVANMTYMRPFLTGTRANVIGGATATNTSQPRQGLPRFDRMNEAVATHDIEDGDEDDDDMVIDTPPLTSPESGER